MAACFPGPAVSSALSVSYNQTPSPASLPLLHLPHSLSFSELVVLVPAPEDNGSSPRASPLHP